MNNIMDKRRCELIKISGQIRQEKIYIQNDLAAIERMNKSRGFSGWSADQVEIRRSKNLQREKVISTLEKRADDVEKGFFDSELSLSAMSAGGEIRAKEEENKKKKDEDRIKNKKVSSVSKDFEQNARRSDRNVSYNKREMDKSFQYFVKTKETIPEYMLKKLKTMPNNKGYIWKSIYCYGERPAIFGEPIIMFETQKDGLLVIHETTDKEYKIWYKKGTCKKILHSCMQRRKIKSAVSSLGNYIR